MKKIFLVIVALFATFTFMTSCTQTQEEEARTEKVDEEIYAQDSIDTEAVIDSISGETADSLSLMDIDAIDAERAVENLAKNVSSDSETPDAMELDDQNQ